MAAESEAVSVTFTITFDFMRYYTEDELGGTNVAARLRYASTIEGSIDIARSGSPTVRVVDELAPWVQNLCFRAVPNLATGEPVQVLYYSRSGHVDLVPKGDEIEISGDKVPTSAFPGRALTQALVDCGGRFLAFAKEAKGTDPDYMANIDYIGGFEGSARAAVE